MIELKYNSVGEPFATEGYFAWLKSLKPGDEVALKRDGWGSRYEKQTIIENLPNSNKILLSDSTVVNKETGRRMYRKYSYSDNTVHLIPISDEMRYDWEFATVREQYRKAVDTKLTISEMVNITEYINKVLTRRKSHIPIVEGDVYL